MFAFRMSIPANAALNPLSPQFNTGLAPNPEVASLLANLEENTVRSQWLLLADQLRWTGVLVIGHLSIALAVWLIV